MIECASRSWRGCGEVVEAWVCFLLRGFLVESLVGFRQMAMAAKEGCVFFVKVAEVGRPWMLALGFHLLLVWSFASGSNHCGFFRRLVYAQLVVAEEVFSSLAEHPAAMA